MARFHSTADGEVPFTQEEELERDAEEAAWVAAEPQRLRQNRIEELEALSTERRKREAILGLDNGWLQNLDNQIADIREGRS
jgi:hypothetical protein